MNPRHEDQIRPGNFLISEPSLYLVESFLGHGTFGTVAKCTRVNDTATVAIKLIKSSHRVEAFLEVGNKYYVREHIEIGLQQRKKVHLVIIKRTSVSTAIHPA